MELTTLSFRGHNLILEIQGTLSSSLKHPPYKTMWQALKISYALIALCLFPLAIGGYWAYGNKMTKDGLLNTLWEFHKDDTSTTILGLIVIFLVVKQLCDYQIYALPAVDNLEFHYVMAKRRPCPLWLKRVLRVICVSSNFFFAVALPFLPIIGPVTGVFNMSVTFVFPCFMWNAIKKPKIYDPMFWLNLGLGCLGILMCIVFLVASIWNLSKGGLTPNFFHP